MKNEMTTKEVELKNLRAELANYRSALLQNLESANKAIAEGKDVDGYAANNAEIAKVINETVKKIASLENAVDEEIISEYVVSVEAQDAAVEGEVATANANSTPIENNLTVNVLAINGKGKITLNGEIVTKTRANSELWAAHDGDFAYTYAVLYTDELAIKKSGVEKNEIEDGKVKIVDFGRDEIPHVNAKVDAIIAEYRAKAKAEDEEKARRESYKASPKGRLEELQLKISCVEDEIRYGKKFIANQQKRLISYQSYIAEVEDEITETGLEIEKAKVAIEKYKAEKVQLEDSIRNKAMNAVAAEIEDDGTNEDNDVTVADTYVEDEDDDDELADDLIIIKTEKVVPVDDEEEEMTIAAATFDLDRFSEDYEKSAAKIRAEIDELATQIAVLQEKLEDKQSLLETKAEEVTDWAYKQVRGIAKPYFIEVVTPYGSHWTIDDDYCISGWSNLYFDAVCHCDKTLFHINLYTRTIATYTNAKDFTNAVAGLANAINRGDSEYTFPAEK